MATFVEISPDPFASIFASVSIGMSVTAESRANSLLAGEFDHVRRPLRGIQIKKDTYATIEVRTSDGRNIPLTDTGSLNDEPKSNRYSNFLINEVNEPREEKTQIILTFGEPYIFFYGEQPRMIQVSGVLLNTEDFQWRAEWWQNYDQYLRGTKCVEKRARVYLSWDDILVEGYLVNCSARESAENRNFTTLQFTMFLTNYASIANLTSTDFPGSDSVEVNINPMSLDTTGEGIGTLDSSTLAVRQLNLENEMASKSSLLQFVRDGLTALTSVNDAFMDLMQTASQFLGGRLVRVPIGYGGSAVFDDMQLAQASISGLGVSNTVYISEQLGNRAFLINATVGNRWEGVPKSRRGAINLNTDEYISKMSSTSPGVVPVANVFADQKVQESKMESKMREVFAAYGISTAPPSDLLILAGRATFAMMNLAAPAGGGGIATTFGQFGL